MKTKNNFSNRKCLICKKIKNKSQLIRFYIFDSELFIDINQNKQYRGYYVCNNHDEIIKFIKIYQFNKKKNIKINENIFNFITK
ncbi:MAG: YlxR family protein [Ureaplasma sp.]|nr:YlxR family protein [Ureaplasma sp.]